MSIDDIVSVTITDTQATPDRESFGTGMIVVKGPTWSERVRTYTRFSALTADFSDAESTPYKMGLAYFSQDPRPKELKVGRRATGFTDAWALTVQTAVQNTAFSVDVYGSNVTYVEASSAATTSTVAAAIAALIAPIVGVTATNAGPIITVTADASNDTVQIADWDLSQFKVKHTATSSGADLQADLTAIEAEDPDFYAFAIDMQDDECISAASAWVSTRDKEFYYDCADSDVLDTTDTDIASVLKAASRTRVIGMYNGQDTEDFRGVAAMGAVLVLDPGSYSLKFKTLEGIVADTLTGTQRSNALGKKINIYENIQGLSGVHNGTVAQGEFEDVIRFRDWLKAELQLQVFAALSSLPKVPYTDPGVDYIKSIVKAVLRQGIEVGGIAPDPVPTVTAPLVADVDPIDRANRLLPDVEFGATLAGAIHAVEIEGRLSV